VRYASVCDGIGAAHVAFQPLGWTCAWRSEIDPFAKAVVEERWPGIGPDLGDMTKITDEEIARHGPVDLVCGGTPCQSFSVAGLRKGLDDPRGNLALAFLGLADRTRAEWLVWENVPGVLSSNGGRDFGAFLGGLGELGYGWAYRVLDAQYFGLAQRRKRVFVVARLGDWRAPAAVLFERASLRGDLAPGREAGADLASAVTRGLGSGGPDDNKAQGNHLVTNGSWGERDGGSVARPLTAPRNGSGGGGRYDLETETLVAHSLRADGFDASADGTGRGTPLVAFQCHGSNVGEMGTLRAGNGNTAGGVPFVATEPTAFNWQSGGDCRVGGSVGRTDALQRSQTPAVMLQVLQQNTGAGGNRQVLGADEPYPTLNLRQPNALASASSVRRLTPREAERLQGFGDDYTLVTYRGKPAADEPRYRALGNSWAIPCVVWIAKRIEAVEALADGPRGG